MNSVNLKVCLRMELVDEFLKCYLCLEDLAEERIVEAEPPLRSMPLLKNLGARFGLRYRQKTGKQSIGLGESCGGTSPQRRWHHAGRTFYSRSPPRYAASVDERSRSLDLGPASGAAADDQSRWMQVCDYGTAVGTACGLPQIASAPSCYLL